MPDFFFGKPFPVSGFPPDTPEKQKALGEFFSGPAEPTKTAGLVPELVKELTEHSSGTIKKWAALGYCWGGKVISLSSKAGTPFVAAAECHPAMVDANDAKDITVPMALLPSGDEDKEDVKKFKEALKTESLVETFADQLHVSRFPSKRRVVYLVLMSVAGLDGCPVCPRGGKWVVT